MAAATPKAVSLKLLIDTKAQRVVFAEAEKPFVDFLFYLMSLPLGTVIKLISQESMVGALGNVYGSIAGLSDTYLQPGTNKDSFLNPKVPFLSPDVPLLMPADYGGANSTETKKLYVCSVVSGSNVVCRNRNTIYYSDEGNTNCPGCNRAMSTVAIYVSPVKKVGSVSYSGDEGGGFVRGVVSYMVMDDLKVMPQSTITAITTLNENNVKDFGSLEVKVVHLEADVGLKLLKASLQTESVLTTVFLGN
ncbi:unnamed protein product [Cuscuta epithymum]|uniref:DUF674 domain-containing protein n=1 Tax=Cuscuta epithymum TaxID=186058 RepID=A0AAV0D6L5_9ASTE|nr:unnamed protein product [Cuscuta epithymum]